MSCHHTTDCSIPQAFPYVLSSPIHFTCHPQLSHTACMDSRVEHVDTERLGGAVESATGQPEASRPLKTPEGGLVRDPGLSAAQRILNDAAANKDVYTLLEVSQASQLDWRL
jgi:hypothetical protein